MYLSVMLMDSIHLNSAIVPVDIVGVLTAAGRRDQEPGHHLVHNLKTVTNQMNLSVLKLNVSTTETTY